MAQRVASDDEAPGSLLSRLSPYDRARVLMALLALVIAGVGLVALVMIGGRRLRRIARSRPGPTRTNDDDWYRKPLAGAEPRPPKTSGPSDAS